MARLPLMTGGGVTPSNFSALGQIGQTVQSGLANAQRLRALAEERQNRAMDRARADADREFLGGLDFSDPGAASRALLGRGMFSGATALSNMANQATAQDIARQRLGLAQRADARAASAATRAGQSREQTRQSTAQFLVDQGIVPDLDTGFQAVDAGFADDLFKQKTETPEQPKPPTGFRFVAGGTRLEPIPGGPGEQLSGEVAGRIGLAEDALKQLPAIEKSIAQGAVTGILDAADAFANRGEAGRIIREVTAGAEALTRMLTGAGMNKEEAVRESRLYIPELTDTKETAADKVRQLQRRLKAVVDVASRGRGGTTSTGEAAGVTSSGVTWSAN